MIMICIPVLLPTIVIVMMYFSFASSVEMQMIDVQTQIDTILSMSDE